jgi:periplasmic protein TonB
VGDYDQPPRALKLTRPVYPQEAFIKKVEGVVTVEFVIELEGDVRSARVIRSVPLLDQAAMETVKQWRFAPAIKKGRKVTARATAPVSFRIF